MLTELLLLRMAGLLLQQGRAALTAAGVASPTCLADALAATVAAVASVRAATAACLVAALLLLLGMLLLSLLLGRTSPGRGVSYSPARPPYCVCAVLAFARWRDGGKICINS